MSDIAAAAFEKAKALGWISEPEPIEMRVLQVGRNDPVSAEESAANVETFKARLAKLRKP